MTPEKAAQIMSGFSYRPEWRFKTTSIAGWATCVRLVVTVTQPDSDVAYAPAYTFPRVLDGEYWLDVHLCETDEDLANLVFEVIAHIEEHERREFLAISGNAYHKPFHPHTETGCDAWNERKPTVSAMGVLVMHFGLVEGNE